MGCTCGEPDEIELTTMGVKLNGWRRVPACAGEEARCEQERGRRQRQSRTHRPAHGGKSGEIFRVGICLDPASPSTRTMHPMWVHRADERAESN